MFSLKFLRQMIPNFDRLLGWSELGREPENYSLVVPVFALASKKLLSRHRGWRAYSGASHQAQNIKLLAKLVGSRMLDQFDTADAKGKMTEESTKVYLIDPVLNILGWHQIPDWHGLSYEYYLSNKLRPDAFANGVAMEFKKHDPLYDQLDATNRSNNSYDTTAQQCAAYHGAQEVNCVIYSNGSFWWRLERDDETKTFCALRFNMRAALNKYRSRMSHAAAYNSGVPYNSPELERFVSLFHADAFWNGNNYAEFIHLGWQSANYGDIGSVWLKGKRCSVAL